MKKASLFLAASVAAVTVVLHPSPAAASAPVAPASTRSACVAGGPTASDAALATSLNGALSAKMSGSLDAYRVSCARAVVNQVKKRGLGARAAVLAVTTVIVETGIVNLNVELDHDSLGLFQQRATWGSEARRLDPVWATNAFLNKMRSLYPAGSWRTAPIGEVGQAVQVSAFPARYQPQAGDAQKIVDALWPGAVGGGDFDADGKPDLLARSAGTKDLYLYRGNGTGGFRAGTGAMIGHNWSPFDILVNVGDFDGDGDADLIARNATTKALYLYRGNGSGGFQAGPGRVIAKNWSAFDKIVAAGDWDSDGDPDLIVRNATTKNLHLFRGNGSGGFTAGTGGVIARKWSAFDAIIGVGDWDGDGDADLLARNARTHNLHLYQGNGSGGFAAGTGGVIGLNWSTVDTIIGAGDWDGDGHPDLIVRNATTKALNLFQGNGSGAFQADAGGLIGNNWSAFDVIF